MSYTANAIAFFSVSLIVWCFATEEANLQDLKQNCTKVNITYANVKHAHEGWPHRIDCRLFLVNVDYSLYHYRTASKTDSNFLCQIYSNNGTLLHNSTFNNDLVGDLGGYMIDDLKSTDENLFQLFVRDISTSRCFTIDLVLRIVPYEDSCQEFIKSAKTPFPRSLNQTMMLRCKVGRRTFPRLYESTNVTFEWKHNCNFLKPELLPQANSSTLIIPSLSYEDVGVYSCSVTHKGKTRQYVSHSVCINEPLSGAKPILSCSALELFSFTGNTVVFECFVDFGFGNFQDSEVSITWKRVGGNKAKVCQSEEYAVISTRIYCVYTTHDQCNIPLITNATKIDKAKARVLLTIRNISDDDFGKYLLFAETNAHRSTGRNDWKFLYLKPNKTSLLKNNIYFLVISSLLLLFILIALFFLYKRIALQVKVFIKKNIKNSRLDDKDYGASLWYNYSTDLDSFGQNETKYVVKEVKQLLEDMSYSVLDIREYGTCSESRMESIQTAIQRSHRVIIFLTTGFINDDWDMLVLQQSFCNMVETGSKIIFILPPGVAEHIKQESEVNEKYKMLQRALKINSDILWKEKSKKVKMKLELAMPKLTRSQPKHNVTPDSKQVFV